MFIILHPKSIENQAFFGVLWYNFRREKAAVPEKKSITLPNGEIYAYLEQGEEKKAAGPSFLLIHGNASSSLHYLPLFRNMSNVHLLAPDLRGFGDSSHKTGFSCLSELADDIKLFAGALGLKNAHVIGWSAGGGIAMELAVKYPDFVSSLFIIQGVAHKGFPLYKKNPDGGHTPFESREDLAKDCFIIKPALAALENRDERHFYAAWKASIYVNREPSAEDNMLYIAETMKQRNLVDLDWALINFNMSDTHNGYSEGTGTIDKIKCPVAFTCAGLDRLIPPATARENADAVKGSKLIEYPESGHSPLIDCPERLAADILAHAGITAKS